MTTIPARVFWILLIVALLCAGTFWAFLGLLPPTSMTLAAGPVDGAYHRVAVRYQSILARDGIAVEILDTEGSVDNLDRLSSGQADAAILQGGLSLRDRPIEAIGKIFYEPVLFLARPGLSVDPNPALWHDLVINRGRDGSGAAAAFAEFRVAAGLPLDANSYVALGYSEAVRAIAEGEIDIGVFVAPFNAPYLIEAYANPDIQFIEIAYAEAISRRWEQANVAVIPAGAISLAPVVPDEPRHLLVLEAHLAIPDDLHPALVNRLTMAALELHGNRGILSDQGQFPAVTDASFPMNASAREIIRNGPSVWHERLPYWIAAQVNRAFVLLLPLLFLVVPLLRALPAAYAYAMNYRVWQHYPAMRAIENKLAAGVDAETLDRMDAELATLDERISSLRLPMPYRPTAYHARLHLELLQKHITAERNRLG